jgi:cell division protein FtsB
MTKKAKADDSKRLADENTKLRSEVDDLKLQVAAGRPEELKALREMNDRNKDKIATLEREIRRLKGGQ